jgi:hypothetical protein
MKQFQGSVFLLDGGLLIRMRTLLFWNGVLNTSEQSSTRLTNVELAGLDPDVADHDRNHNSQQPYLVQCSIFCSTL